MKLNDAGLPLPGLESRECAKCPGDTFIMHLDWMPPTIRGVMVICEGCDWSDVVLTPMQPAAVYGKRREVSDR